jgi:hypothetical protein
MLEVIVDSTRSGKPITRKIDPRNWDDVEYCINVRFPLMSEMGLRDVLVQIKTAPEYVRNWAGTKRLIEELNRRGIK